MNLSKKTKQKNQDEEGKEQDKTQNERSRSGGATAKDSGLHAEKGIVKTSAKEL